jgi:hypothetical protein
MVNPTGMAQTLRRLEALRHPHRFHHLSYNCLRQRKRSGQEHDSSSGGLDLQRLAADEICIDLFSRHSLGNDAKGINQVVVREGTSQREGSIRKETTRWRGNPERRERQVENIDLTWIIHSGDVSRLAGAA